MMLKVRPSQREFGNENTVEIYHVFCRDLINCGSFDSARVSSKENGQNVPRGMES
jgi:hypothetical protein